ncbi:MAG: hypothetical protein IPK82_42825 [Polyangiaceae bacterium]|nr:hypothetical protein [Polyangiaceae bacterium]
MQRVCSSVTLDIQGRASGAISPEIAGTWRRISHAQWIVGNEAAAEASLQKAVALPAPREKEQAAALVESLDKLASLFQARSLPAEARSTLDQAIRKWRPFRRSGESGKT